MQPPLVRAFANDHRTGCPGGIHVFWRDFQKQTSRRFAKEHLSDGTAFAHWQVFQFHLHASLAGEGHFSERYSKATFGEIVSRQDSALLDQFVILLVSL